MTDYDNNKKWELLQSEMLNCSAIQSEKKIFDFQSEKILFKVLVTI